jgi:CDP-4-dehydro-6-deoxyglucose reductase
VPVLSDAREYGMRNNLVHKAVLEDHPSLAAFQAYVCGVPVMTQAAKAEFIAAGLPEGEFFADAFVTRAEVAAAGP